MHFCISLATVITNMLLHTAEKMIVTWCQDPTKSNRWQLCCSSFYGCVSLIHWLGTKWLLSFQSSEETHRFQNVAEVWLRVVLLSVPQSSILTTYSLISQGTSAWTIMWTSRPLFCLVRNVTLNKKLPNKQIFATHFYFPINAHINPQDL